VSAFGGENAEAAASVVARAASNAWDCALSGSPVCRQGRVWDSAAGLYVSTSKSEEAGALLGDARALQATYYRQRQGWLDRGTVLNRVLDAFAAGAVKAKDAVEYAASVLEEPAGFSESGAPYPWQCDDADVLARARSLGDWLSKGRVEVLAAGVRAFDKNRRLTGEADWIGTCGDTAHIGELKSGTEQKAHALQLAAYWSLFGSRQDAEGVVLYVRPDGWREVRLAAGALSKYAKAFNHLFEAYKTMMERPEWKTAASWKAKDQG
jgi:hypothetical protein